MIHFLVAYDEVILNFFREGVALQKYELLSYAASRIDDNDHQLMVAWLAGDASWALYFFLLQVIDEVHPKEGLEHLFIRKISTK